MRKFSWVLMAAALTACVPGVPDSGDGVGFENYGDFQTARNAELQGETPATTNVLPPANGAATQPPANAAAGAPATNAAPLVTTNNPNISDEQDFAAVSGRESIESDRERLAAQRKAYKVIQPTAVPTRSGKTGPNIVQFALSTTNQVGQKIYTRSALFAESRYLRNCGKYPSPDLAQEAFLRAGGPERDKAGIDPDGDGFACSWDPTPFRQVSASQG